MSKTNRAREIIRELNDFCDETGKFDRACQIEWLLYNYSDVFGSAVIADRWISALRGE